MQIDIKNKNIEKLLKEFYSNVDLFTVSLLVSCGKDICNEIGDLTFKESENFSK